MIQTKVKLNLGDVYEEIGHTPVVPINIPTMDEIDRLAQSALAKDAPYTGEAWGWPVSYETEVPEPVPHSKQPFRPAVFTIGVYPIWFISFTWEHGKTQAPTVLVEDENLVAPYPVKSYALAEANGHAITR